MPHNAERYLLDIQSACQRIETYATGLQLESYTRNLQARDAIERCLEIVGEALRQGIRHNPELAKVFPDATGIIGLRNILAHEYGEVDDDRVWFVVQGKIPALLAIASEELERRA